MARTLIVSDKQNSFFTANNIKVGTEIPTSGTYSKGDIIVNIGNNTATEAMWICVEAGTPGTWEVVGAGAGGGGSIVAINDTLTINSAVTEVSLGNLVGKISSSDKLIVHYNSTHLMEGVDYEVNSEGTGIVKLTEGSWNESGEQALFAFELFKNVESVNGNEIVVDTKLTSIVNNMMVTAPTTEVEIGVEGFDKNSDTLLVFKNGVIMVEGVDYNVSEDNTKIISINEVWNESNVEEYGITFVVFKEVVVYDEATGGITMGMLGSDVRETINNLTETTLQHSNLLENIDGKYATKEDLENIEVDLSPYQQKTDNNLQTSSKDVIGAINELFQSANNGKELIASAIGEPLNSEDTFSAMSNDINGLLSTFKTNMMNNGITVESGDKFKSLIDKIATMVEEGEGKGIQFAEGEGEWIVNKSNTPNTTTTVTINIENDFKPTIVFLYFEYLNFYKYATYSGAFASTSTASNIWIKNDMSPIYAPSNETGYVAIDTKTSEIDITVRHGMSVDNPEWDGGVGLYHMPSADIKVTKWIAIGVGEEDTTLRDSLASILEDEGVEVTEEDDMASLISKVDEEFDNKNANSGLDIISATELPDTGVENQICVITDEPVNNYLVTTCADEKLDVGITFYLDNTASVDPMTGVTLPITTGNLTTNYHFSTVYQNDNRLPSYYYSDNKWNELTLAYIALVENGVVNINTIAGDFSLGSSGWASMSEPVQSVYCSPNYDNYYANSFANKINFGNYSKITVRCFEDGAVIPDLIVFASTTKHTREAVSTLYTIYMDSQQVTGGWAASTIITFDISSWTGEYYLSFAGGKSGSGIYIEDIFLY